MDSSGWCIRVWMFCLPQSGSRCSTD
jgi:hypothetical protein